MEYSDSYEYCYDRENKNLLVRYSEDGTIKKYVYGNGLIATSETKESDDSVYSTYLYDIRGSVTFALDESANTISEYRYSTYGNRHVIKGDSTSELGYCAREGVLTEVTGLLYMRARYYYPDLMRFINQDIVTGDISNSNSLNRYTYVEGNPATLIDPFGLCAEKAGAGLLNTIHNIFDVVGFIPGIGDACDGINGLIYLCEGDLFNAGMSLMSLIPLGDIFAKGGKWVKKFAKWFSKSDEIIDTTKALTKYGGEAMELAQKAANKADETIELAQKGVGKTDEVAGAVKSVGNGKQYSVMYEASPGKGSTRSAHRNAANKEFYNQMANDSQFKEAMDEFFGYDVMEHMESGKSGLKNPSSEWVWHHPADNPEAIQLVPKSQHQSSIYQPLMHPGENGMGGFGLFFNNN